MDEWHSTRTQTNSLRYKTKTRALPSRQWYWLATHVRTGKGRGGTDLHGEDSSLFAAGL